MQFSARCSSRAHAARPAAARRAPAVLHGTSGRRPAVAARAALKALIFDCDGAVLDRQELQLRAINEALKKFKVQRGGEDVEWSLQDLALVGDGGGSSGEPMARRYFKRSGWPTSSVLDGRAPADEAERAALVDALQSASADAYQRMVGSGEASARPGVLRLIDEATAAGVPVSVCGAAPRGSLEAALGSLLGSARAAALGAVVGGDDVSTEDRQGGAYAAAAARLGAAPSECVVVTDGADALQSAMGAGMRCIVTYTAATKWQEFPGAERIVSDLASGEVTVAELKAKRIVQDDRVNMVVTDAGVFWSKGGGDGPAWL